MIRNWVLIALSELCSTLMAQTVSNVSAEQVGNNIVVSYDLDKVATISVCYSTDGGKTYSLLVKEISGDVGKNVCAGHKQITWNVLNDMETLVCDNLVFKVTACDEQETFIVNGVKIEMVKVEGGTFTMGATLEQGVEVEHDEKPVHEVTLDDYYIGKFEVSQELWLAVMGKNPSKDKGNMKPVNTIYWYDCLAFVNKLNELLSSQLGGKHFALPTEAQWEYAARGGKKSQGYKYAGSNNVDAVAWNDDNSNKKIHIVGEKQPNELGIYDMSGNVWEWCQDWYGRYSSDSQSNPVGAEQGETRVIRGGSWYTIPRNGRVSYRFYTAPRDRFSDLGIRVVLIE